MYQPRKNEGLERNFRGIRTVFERCYKPGLILGVFFGLFWVIWGALRLPFFVPEMVVFEVRVTLRVTVKGYTYEN